MIVGFPSILKGTPWPSIEDGMVIDWGHPMAKDLILALVPVGKDRGNRNTHRGCWYDFANNAHNLNEAYSLSVTNGDMAGVSRYNRAWKFPAATAGVPFKIYRSVDTATTPLSHFCIIQVDSVPASTKPLCWSTYTLSTAFYSRIELTTGAYHERWYANSSSSSQSGSVTIPLNTPLCIAGVRGNGYEWANSASIYVDGVYKTAVGALTSGRSHLGFSIGGGNQGTCEHYFCCWYQWARGITIPEQLALREHPFALFYKPRRYFVVPSAPAASGAISGTCAVTADGSATLAGAGALTATCAVAVTGTASLTGNGTLAATCAWVFGGDGTLIGAGGIQGSVATVTGGTGTLLGDGGLAGECLLTVVVGSGNLTGTGALTGDCAVVFDGSGTLTGSGGSTSPIAGTVQVVVSGNGALLGAGSMSGDCSAVVLGSGVLLGSGTLAGSVVVVVDGDGTLAGPGALAGICPVVFSGFGTAVSPAKHHRAHIFR